MYDDFHLFFYMITFNDLLTDYYKAQYLLIRIVKSTQVFAQEK